MYVCTNLWELFRKQVVQEDDFSVLNPAYITMSIIFKTQKINVIVIEGLPVYDMQSQGWGHYNIIQTENSS